MPHDAPRFAPCARRRWPAAAWLAAATGVLGLAVTTGCGTSRLDDGSSVEYVAVDRRGGTDRVRWPRSGDDGLAPEAWRDEVTVRCQEIEPLMRVAAMKERVDVGLIAGIIHVESAFRPEARSRAGARGLMQVMPKVGKSLKCGDLEDPQDNIRCGVTILKRFLERYDHHVILGLSAYNAGYKVPNAALESNTLPSNYRYVERVLASRVAYLRHGCGL